MPRVDSRLRLRVATASKELRDHWSEGTSIERRTGVQIQALAERVTADRLQLAYRVRRSGALLIALTPPMNRVAVGRYYYAMYHAMRSVVFFHHGGDDYEGHSALPVHAPHDFPDRDRWANALKEARLDRNRADYDAYPKADSAWAATVVRLRGDSDAFLPIARNYLRAKGCPYV